MNFEMTWSDCSVEGTLTQLLRKQVKSGRAESHTLKPKTGISRLQDPVTIFVVVNDSLAWISYAYARQSRAPGTWCRRAWDRSIVRDTLTDQSKA